MKKIPHRPPLWRSLTLVTSCLWGNSLSFVGSSWKFISDYIKNVDAYQVSVRKKQVINKNWVTVRDKCSQINVRFKWHTSLKKIKNFERTDKQTDKRINKRTNERTDWQSDFIMPRNLFGGIKSYSQKAFDKLIWNEQYLQWKQQTWIATRRWRSSLLLSWLCRWAAPWSGLLWRWLQKTSLFGPWWKSQQSEK